MTIAEMEATEQKDENGKRFLLVDGEKATRVYSAANGFLPSCWPLESQACGVNPNQVQEAIAADRARGVPTRYNPNTGNPIFESNGHRRKWLKSQNYRDHDSYI